MSDIQVTADDQRQLVVQTVKDLNSLREHTYAIAQGTLETLRDARLELPLSMVDVEIGTDLEIVWTATGATVTSPEEPTWIDTAITALPSAPTVPDVSYTVPTLEETAPAALTGSLGEVSAPTVDVVEVPELGTVPTISVTTPTMPTLEAVSSVSAAAPALGDLETIPTITAVAPSIDPSVLTTEFSWDEAAYTGRISTDLQTALLGVLGGGPVLSQAYWDARIATINSELSRERTARLRTARNRGAATFWDMPSEAITAGTRAIEDELAKVHQKARLDVVMEQTRQAREDFWEAVNKGLAYEQMWVSFHDHMAQRSLSAAEQLANVAINVHNANAGYYNIILGLAKLALDKDIAGVDRGLRIQQAQLQANEQAISGQRLVLDADKTQADIELRTNQQVLDQLGREIDIARLIKEVDQAELEAFLQAFKSRLEGSQQKLEKIKVDVQAYQAEWSAKTGAFNADSQRGMQSIQRFGEVVRAWGQEIDGNIRAKQLPLEVSKVEAQMYSAQYSSLSALAQATNTIMTSRIAVQDLGIRAAGLDLEIDKAKNAIEVERGKLDQSGQDTKARIDIAQSNWITGQALSIEQNIAQLAWQYAQAVAVASDVSLTSSGTLSDSFSLSHSKDLAD